MKTKWNLTLLYKFPTDPRIERDIAEIKNAYEQFAKKYRNKTDYLKNEKGLLRVLTDYEKLIAKVGGGKPLAYFEYSRTLDSTDQKMVSRCNQLHDQLTMASNKILFFELSLGKIEKRLQKKFLHSKKLIRYRYFLQRTFENGEYDLTEQEEQILKLKNLPSHSLWKSGFSRFLNKQTVRFRDKNLPISEAMNKVATLPTEARRKLSGQIMDTFYAVSDFAGSEINAIYIDKKINDELRGFRQPYSATILRYENDQKSILNLVEIVTNNFYISRRFYKLKAKLLDLKHLEYGDEAVSIGKTRKKIEFKKEFNVLQEVFYGADKKYGVILDEMIKNGQIDVFPKTGKAGGAFCSGGVSLPTFVLLNHTGNFRSIMTFAHEMGHAIHKERSKQQSSIYQNATASVGETASKFFETLVFNAIFETLSDREKIIALHDKIQWDISSVFKQVACFNFELELHRRIRETGSLPKEDIALLMNKHMKAYLGPVFKLKEQDGYFFVAWPHIRNFFYVYSYAYGQLISKALHEKYRADAQYIKQIDQFLSAGGSKSPKNIFKEIGVDTTGPNFFKAGLESIKDDIIYLENIAKRMKI
ncbi:hypothetical protein CL630_03830 [bacterium]|nr:hypothetical protein [bacterium]|tara:strand:- start:46788 stop:48551 length:1764 start_codon:yes stop_codon:yes gene_type:complete